MGGGLGIVLVHPESSSAYGSRIRSAFQSRASTVRSSSERIGCASLSKASIARYHRLVKALGELVSD